MKLALTTNFSNSVLAAHPLGFDELKTALVEPALVLGAALFWVAVLPFVALCLMSVKIWDTLHALRSGEAIRPNPLILRRGLRKSGLAVGSSTRAAQI